MPRRSQRQAVAERAEARLEAQATRRREAAQRGAQTRRQRREAQPADATLRSSEAPSLRSTRGQPPAQPERAPRRNLARPARSRVHTDLVTVAFRGPLAERTRALSGRCELSLAKLLQDALLVYEQKLAEGYQPGATLAQWKEQASG